MNKYLKILTLSGGLLGAFTPSIMSLNSDINNNLNSMCESVQNINASTYNLSKNLRVGLSNQQTRSSLDEQTQISQEETINYLDNSLNEANTEYENLRKTLIDAINQTTEYLKNCEENSEELTDEQKLYIKEQSNTIKYLASTLTSLNQEVIKCMDGCENCEDYDKLTNMYIFAIRNLERQIQALQNSLMTIQTINGAFIFNEQGFDNNEVVYGLHFGRIPYAPPKSDIEEDDTNNATDNNVAQDSEITDNELNNDDTINTDEEDENILQTTKEDLDNTEDSKTSKSNKSNDNSSAHISPMDELEEVDSESDNNTESTDEDGTNIDTMNNFGIKPNIDTYGPTNKNIDTFFNTALIDNDFMYGGGGMHYGGYGMPYGQAGYGYYNNGYNQTYNRMNSNYNMMDHGFNTPSHELNNKDNNSLPTNPKNKKMKRSKNVDTYTETTIEPNINTMGKSRLSDFLKDKFSNIRNKIKSHKKGEQSSDFTLPHRTKDIQDNDIKPNNSLNNNIDNKLKEFKEDSEQQLDELKDKFNNKIEESSNNYDLTTLEEPIQDNLPASANVDENFDMNVEQFHFPKTR